MPPRVTVKQAAQLAKSLASGTPHAGKIALTIASDAVREMI
jgi:pyruvate dehydrogenase (quinone)/pyruvate oxidase